MNTREQSELAMLRERVAQLEFKCQQWVSAWSVTYHYGNGKQDVFLVFKPEDVHNLVNNTPIGATVKIRAVSKEELARPDDGKDDSI